MSVLAPVVEAYRLALAPIAPFTWFGLSFCTLDVAAAIRLCVALRQLREKFYRDHVQNTVGTTAADAKLVRQVERRSWVRDVSATLVVVYGGEAVIAPALGIPPTFMISGTVPAFYAVIQALVDGVPSIPYPTLYSEFPISALDGFSRAFLLCTFIPPMVLQHSWQSVATSPWSLLLTSLVTANGGFFFINLFSFLHPYALTLTTPAELLPYGWTMTDLWCAPLITGLYALLTHAQPFWTHVHAAAVDVLGSATGLSADPVDPEVARALCATILATMFATRAYRTYGMLPVQDEKPAEKTKVQ